MRIQHANVAGLDVHKKVIVAAIIVQERDGSFRQAKRTFESMTADLLNLSDWMLTQGVSHVAMESTGEYWKPVFNILENNFEVIVVNAQHLSRVPGRKTDQSDAEWIAELHQYGLLKASFIPPLGQRELRELTRYRSTFIQERATLINRVQKVLESANIKLASVASDVLGVSGRAILEAIVQGGTQPLDMAELAKGRLRQKREALTRALEGRVKPHHRFVLAELLTQIDSLDETIVRFDQQIEDYCRPFVAAVSLLDTIPGVSQAIAEVIVAEIGTDMSRFPNADHLAAWAGVAPGNNESAGKRRSGKTRQGNKSLGAALNQAAHTATRMKDTYLAAQYHRLVIRRGKKKAIVAVMHSILRIAYHMILRNEPYHDLGANYFDTHRPETKVKYLIQQLEKFGYRASRISDAIPMVA